MIDLDRIEADARFQASIKRAAFVLPKDVLAMVAAIRAAQKIERILFLIEGRADPINEFQDALAPFTDSEEKP